MNRRLLVIPMALGIVVVPAVAAESAVSEPLYAWVDLMQRMATEPALPPPPPPVVTTTTTEAPIVVGPTTTTTTSVPPVSVPVQQPSASNTDAVSTTTPDWACIRDHESGDTYTIVDTPYSGAYQSLDTTWGGFDGYPIAADAPPAVQDQWALELYAMEGWSPWSTRYICGL